MIWDSEYPQDELDANTLHAIIQNVKVLLRERFELNNGTWKEHGDADSSTAGQHSPSLTGFCGYANSWAERPTVDLVNGSIWYIDGTDGNEGIYYIKNGTYKRVAPISHTQLDFTQYDETMNILNPHTQYILKDGGTVTTDIEFNTLQLVLSLGGSSYCLPKSHIDQKWADAHNAGLLKGRHFAADVGIPWSLLPISEIEGDDEVLIPDEADIIFLPRPTSAPNNTTKVFMSKDKVKLTGGHIKVRYMEGNFS